MNESNFDAIDAWLEEIEETKETKESSVPEWEAYAQFSSELAQQYVSFKRTYPNDVLLFQCGEFYELWGKDAKLAHQLLDIKLTKRTLSQTDIPMAGIPSHKGLANANALARQGHKVVIVSQKKDEEGEIERFVSQLVTPSTIMEEEFLSPDQPQYLMTAYAMKKELGVVVMDVLSGELTSLVSNKYTIFDLVARYQPKEFRLYLPIAWEPELMQKVEQLPHTEIISVPYFYDEMKTVVEAHRTEHFPNGGTPYLVVAAHYFLLSYLGQVQPQHVTLRPVRHIQEAEYLYLHNTAITGLDLLENSSSRKKDGSLFALLDGCVTSLGSRTLKKWIQEPLKQPEAIQKRQQLVEFFLKETSLRQQLRVLLQNTGDVERILARFETQRFQEHELVIVLETLENYVTFFRLLTEQTGQTSVSAFRPMLLKLQDVVGVLQQKIDKEDIIAVGYSASFDQIRDVHQNGKEQLQTYTEEERTQSKIPTLKLEENKVLGLFFEVTKSQFSKVPAHFMEIQSLTNAKRFETERLKELKGLLAEAGEQYEKIRKQTVKQIVTEVQSMHTFLHKVLHVIATLDIVMSFSERAETYRYQKPIVSETDGISLERAFHPLLQAFSYKKVVPNSISMQEHDIHVVTGPNMGGKTVYLKTVALCVIMAQIGSFVPASMTWKPVDRILLRMGAGDAILSHLSTFAMEMDEVAYIAYHATPNSLVIMDELGRGTSTNDGISIAHAVLRYLHNHIGCKTICSTHYHELIALEEELDHVKNFHAEAKDSEQGILLTYRIQKGGSSKSFGISVAKKIGLPIQILEDAEELLRSKYA